MTGLLQDLRFGFRQFIKRPGWTAAIVLVLALGIGANTTMFSGFEAWVLRPLDFEAPDQLVVLNESQPLLGRNRVNVSAKTLGDWMEGQQSFQEYGAYDRHKFNLSDEAEPVRLHGARVSASLFPMLGKQPRLGRNFSSQEDLPGKPSAVALVSDHLWRTRFGADPQIVGKQVRLDGTVHQIVGVMEPGFKFPEWAEVWTPLGLDPHTSRRNDRWLNVIARLLPGVSEQAARSDLQGIARRLEEQYPDTNRGWSAEILTLREDFVPPVIEVALTASLISAVFVLLVICANVASLILAQASARSREVALRTALGAGRWRLVRQNLSEGVLLAVPAGFVGALLGQMGVGWMLSWIPVDPPYLFAMEFDLQAGIYTLGIAVLAGMVCGLAPVVRQSGVQVMKGLKSGDARTAGGAASRWLRGSLVVGELALSTALLIAALLMVKSFLAMQDFERGFREQGILTAELSLAGKELKNAHSRIAMLDRTLSSLGRLANVQSVGISSVLPASQGNRIWGVHPEGVARNQDEEIQATVHSIAGDYLQTLEIPILSGRDFTDSEKREGAEVVIVSQGLARRLRSDGDVVGRRLRSPHDPGKAWLRIVGVVGNVDVGRDMVNSHQPEAQLYLPYGYQAVEPVSVALQSDADAGLIASQMRQAFRSVAPGVPISEILTMREAIFRIRWVSQFFSRQLLIYAAVATLIAALGLYGLTADSVTSRTRELAVRMAMGARRSDLLHLILREALVTGVLGVLLGIALGFLVSGFQAPMLQGSSARDPVIFASVAALLTLITLAAAFLPARRATALDPIMALRAE